MKQLYLILLLAFISGSVSWSQEEVAYRIQLQIENYDFDTLTLGYHLGQSQFLRDTAVRDESKSFVFEGRKPLAPGVYLVVMQPENKYFQIVIGEEEQFVDFKIDAEFPIESLECENCTDIRIFYDYMTFLGKNRELVDSLNTQLEEAVPDAEIELLEQKIAKVNSEVSTYQQDLISQFPNTTTAVLVKGGLEVEVPDFEESGEESEMLRYRYYKKHYFDNNPLSDKRIIRTPQLFGKIDYYINKLTLQHPDSIISSLDKVLDDLSVNEEGFQYYLVHYLNNYAKSKIVGMDAVYVHLVDKYYATGQAVWTDPDQLKKIIENADALKPTLIGKIAPDLDLETREGIPMKLSDIKADYKIVYFWRPDCPHCKKTTPELIDFYKEWKEAGVEVIAICMKFTKEVPKCWEYLDGKEDMDLWYNLVDPLHKSKYATIYHVKSTPQIFVLDSNHKILSKRIAVEQLPEVLNIFMDREEASGG